MSLASKIRQQLQANLSRAGTDSNETLNESLRLLAVAKPADSKYFTSKRGYVGITGPPSRARICGAVC